MMKVAIIATFLYSREVKCFTKTLKEDKNKSKERSLTKAC